MVSLAGLRETRPQEMQRAAAAWQDTARTFTTLEQNSVSDLIGPIHQSGWTGPAADAAFGHLDGVDDGFELLAEQARAVGLLIDEAASRMLALQRELEQLEAQIHATGARLRADGNVEPAPLTGGESADEHTAAIAGRRHNDTARLLTDRISALLAEATRLDEEYATALTRYALPHHGRPAPTEWVSTAHDARENGRLLGADPTKIPTGKPPAVVHKWWAGLTADQQQAYLLSSPDQIGHLDGLPTLVRDQANRATLEAYVGSQQQSAELDRYTDNSANRVPEEKLLARLEASEYGPTAQRLYLLGVDPQQDTQGNGRAIIAVGNPDLARHTAVMVPGVGSTLAGMNGLIARAEQVRSEADGLTPGRTGDVSVIAWLDYDAPGMNTGAVSDHLSQVGGRQLDHFIDGLHATTPDHAHLSVIGHSYGSTLVGEADSHGNGLAVDDVLTAGSPGMNVDHVTDLHTPANHVWAGAAPGDPISSPMLPAWTRAIAPRTSLGIDALLNAIHHDQPTDTGFGANKYHVDPLPGDRPEIDFKAHSSYWDTGSAALHNQAAVVVGQYSDVTLDRGAPPPDLSTPR